MDHLEHINHNLQAMVVRPEFRELNRVLIRLVNYVHPPCAHLPTVDLDVVQHLRIGHDIVDAVPVVFQALVVQPSTISHVPLYLTSTIPHPIANTHTPPHT